MEEKHTPEDHANKLEEDEINLLELLLVLVRNKVLIVGTCTATFVLACVVTLLVPNVYTATARILPSQQESGGLGGMLGGMGDLALLAGVRVGGSPGDLYVGMLKSRTVADAIIEQFDLMRVYEEEYRTRMYNKLEGLVNISLGKADGIITLKVDDEDPRRAAAIANAYVEELKKLNVRLNLNTAGRERVFLAERISVVGGDLQQAEERLKRFQEEHKAIRLDEQARGLIEAISRLQGELASKEIELGVLLTYQTEQNPQVRSLRESISQVRDQIRRLERSPGGKQVAESIFFATSEVPELGVQFARLMRDYKVQETLFELLTRQYEVAKISEAKNTSTIQVLDEAAAPDRKSKPKRALIVLTATFAAGFVAVIFAFVKEFGQNMSEENRSRWVQIKENLYLRKHR